MSDTIRYVVGFAFNDQEVLLLQKKRPLWQEGKLNGPGGKLELNERAAACMAREFEEETGIPTTPEHWQIFAVLMFRRPDEMPVEVHCFRAHLGKMLKAARSITDEEVVLVRLADVHTLNGIPNVPWLIHMALDKQIDHAIVMYNHA